VTAVARRVTRPWLRVAPSREGVCPGDGLVGRELCDVGWLRHRGSWRVQVMRPLRQGVSSLRQGVGWARGLVHWKAWCMCPRPRSVDWK
jgi:hypothetical protein